MGARILSALSIPILVTILGVVGLLGGQFDNFANDPGVGWHIESGRYIYENLSLPQYDPFLAGPKRTWVSDQWLSDLILYLAFKLGGWSALYNIFAFIFVATFFFLLMPANFRLSGSWIGSSIGVLFAFKISQIHFILRPVVFSFPFFAITLLALLFWDRGKTSRAPWWLAFVFILWSNIHPSFVLGLGLVGIFVIAKSVDFIGLKNSQPPSFKGLLGAIRGPIFLLLVCLGATLINPYGLELHRSILELGQSEFFMRLHEEWLSPNFKESAGKIFLLMLGLVFTPPFFGIQFRWGTFSSLLVIVFSCLALKAVRFLPYTGIALSVAIAESVLLFGGLRIFSDNPLLLRLKNALQSLESRQMFFPFIGITILSGIIIVGTAQNRVMFYSGKFGLPQEKYPYSALSHLKSILKANERVSVLASPDWGGFITLEGQGSIKPIIDDRNTLIGEKLYQDFLGAASVSSRWLAFADQVEADYFIISANSPVRCEVERQNLKIEFEDKNYILVKVGKISE
jgi:hypothetical protein